MALSHSPAASAPPQAVVDPVLLGVRLHYRVLAAGGANHTPIAHGRAPPLLLPVLA